MVSRKIWSEWAKRTFGWRREEVRRAVKGCKRGKTGIGTFGRRLKFRLTVKAPDCVLVASTLVCFVFDHKPSEELLVDGRVTGAAPREQTMMALLWGLNQI